MTITCVSVTSGKASMGSDWKAKKPPATNMMVSRIMNSGWFSAKATRRWSIPLLRLVFLQPDQQRAFAHHALAPFQAGQYAKPAGRIRLHLHRPPHERLFSGCNINVAPSGFREDALGG